MLVGQENDAVGRRFATDGRWLVYVDNHQATELIGAGGFDSSDRGSHPRATERLSVRMTREDKKSAVVFPARK